MTRHAPAVSRGFSIIELVVTMAIFGILIAVALPGLRQWTTDSQVRNLATYVASGLQQAKAEAVRRNYSVRFQLVSSMDAACNVVATGSNWIVSHGDPELAPGTPGPPDNRACGRDVLNTIAFRDNNDPVAPVLQADLDETNLDGDGTPGPAADVDGDGVLGLVAVNSIVPVLLVKGFQERQGTVQATITGLNPVNGLPSGAIDVDANQVVCFNGTGQLLRVFQGGLNKGVCSNSRNPANTEQVAFRIDISDPGAGDCVAAGGPVRCLRVQVSTTGDIRVCDPTLGDPNDPRRCL